MARAWLGHLAPKEAPQYVSAFVKSFSSVKMYSYPSEKKRRESYSLQSASTCSRGRGGRGVSGGAGAGDGGGGGENDGGGGGGGGACGGGGGGAQSLRPGKRGGGRKGESDGGEGECESEAEALRFLGERTGVTGREDILLAMSCACCSPGPSCRSRVSVTDIDQVNRQGWASSRHPAATQTALSVSTATVRGDVHIQQELLYGIARS